MSVLGNKIMIESKATCLTTKSDNNSYHSRILKY